MVFNPDSDPLTDENGDRLAEAIRLIDDLQCEAAIEVLNDLIEADPFNAELYFWRGEAFEWLSKEGSWKTPPAGGEHRQPAMRDYRQAIELRPSFVESYRQLGFLLMKIDEYHQALACFGQAVQLNPHDVDLLACYGLALDNAGLFEESDRHFAMIVERFPSLPESYRQRAEHHRRRERFEKAIADYEKALAVADSSGSDYSERRRCIEYIDHCKEEIAYLMQVAEFEKKRNNPDDLRC